MRPSPRSDSRCSSRLFFDVERKPSKQKRPAGRAESASAVTAAQGPGTAVTSTPLSAQATARSSPGSDTAGIPASVTRAQFSPARMRSRMRSPLRSLLC